MAGDMKRRAEDAAHTKSSAVSRWGFMDSISSVGFKDFRPPKQPDAIAYSVPQIIRFIHTSKAGHVIFYHGGDLANDARADPVMHDKQRYMLMASKFGVVALRQSRVGDQWRQYYAIRTDESLIGIPSAAITGQITPDEYTALTAINERQASISITRVIRDALGISDHEAGEWRNAFIRNGWMTNGRPPELTRCGLSLLA